LRNHDFEFVVYSELKADIVLLSSMFGNVNGHFDISTKAEQSSLRLNVLDIPLNSILNFDSQSSGELTHISLPAKYEGRFVMRSFDNPYFPPILNKVSAIDPAAQRRDRVVDITRKGVDPETEANVILGSVFWASKHDSGGRGGRGGGRGGRRSDGEDHDNEIHDKGHHHDHDSDHDDEEISTINTLRYLKGSANITTYRSTTLLFV
jgi:hypothetical protein